MLRRITLSLAFAASIGVGSAQLVPQSAWSLLSPVNIPTVEWSPTGANVVLTTDSAVEMLNGSTFQLLWSRTVTGAEPSIAGTYGGSDRAHFSPDGSTVWIRSGPSTFTQVSVATGLPLVTHTFTDWTTDYLLTPVGKELVAYNVTLSGSTFTYNLRTYDSTSLSLLTSATSTHAEASGYSDLTTPVGVYGTTDMAFFFNVGINTRTGATTTFTTGGNEAWTFAIDPQGGLLQAIESLSGSTYTPIAAQRLSTSGITWTEAASDIPYTGTPGPFPLVGFLSSTSTPIGILPTSTGFGGFNYMTGAALWAQSVETGSIKAFTYSAKALNPVGGNLVLTTGPSGYATANLSDFSVSATGLTALPAVQSIFYGLAGSAPVSGGSVSGNVIVDPYSNVLQSLGYGGTSNWSGSTVGGPFQIKVSPAADLAAYITSAGVFVVNATTGASVASAGGSFDNVVWGNESTTSGTTTATLLGCETNDMAQYLTLTIPASGTPSIAVTKNYQVADFHVGHAINSLSKYLVGYGTGSGSGALYVFDLGSFSTPPTQNAYTNYNSYWDDSFQIVPLTGTGNVAALEQTSAGAQWTIYQFNPVGGTGPGATISAVTSYTYTPPFTRAAGDRIRGAITPDLKVAAFFDGTSVGTNGTPSSDLTFIRLADGKVLGKIDNVFSYIGSMHFSPDESLLYVTTGGQSANTSLSGAVTLNEAGPSDLQVLNVPAWLTAISANPNTVYSGGTSTITVNLNVPAQGGGQIVNLSGSTGMTVPATMTVPAGQTSGTVTVTCPDVSTTTTCTVTANVNGLGALSTTITDNPPALSTITLSPTSVEAGTTSTATITLHGSAPSTGWKITLAQTGTANSLVSFPSSVTVASGASTATFTVSTISSTNSSSATIQGTDPNSLTASATLSLTPTVITSTVFAKSSVTGGDAVSVVVTIGAPAPTGGFTLGLSNTGSGSADVTFPTTATIAAGKTSVEITGTTVAVGSSTTDSFSAALGSKTGAATLTITPPTIKAVEFVNHTVVGGTSVQVVVLLSGAAASGTTVTLSSSSSALSAPASETFTAGKTEMIYTIPTTTVTTTTSAKLTVTLGTSSGSDTVSIHI